MLIEKATRITELVLREFKKQAYNIRLGIIHRTRNGFDVNGKPFEPYGVGYARFKASKGRPSSPVNLTFTGNMLNSIQVRMGKGLNAHIYVPGAINIKSKTPNAATKAYKNDNGIGVKRRHFWGIDKEQEKAFNEAINSAIRASL